MINCLTPIQKVFASIWAMAGFAMFVAVAALVKVIFEIMAPDFYAEAQGTVMLIAFLGFTAAYLSASFSQRDSIEFLDKLYHALLASFFKNARSEGRVNRWIAEKQILEGWDEHIGRTGRAVNFENICAYLSDEYDIEIDALDEWRANGAARKSLTDPQAQKILKGIAQTVELA